MRNQILSFMWLIVCATAIDCSVLAGDRSKEADTATSIYQTDPPVVFRYDPKKNDAEVDHRLSQESGSCQANKKAAERVLKLDAEADARADTVRGAPGAIGFWSAGNLDSTKLDVPGLRCRRLPETVLVIQYRDAFGLNEEQYMQAIWDYAIGYNRAKVREGEAARLLDCEVALNEYPFFSTWKAGDPFSSCPDDS